MLHGESPLKGSVLEDPYLRLQPLRGLRPGRKALKVSGAACSCLIIA